MARGSVDNSSSSSSTSEGEEEEVVLGETDRISMSKAFPRPAPAAAASSSSAPGAGEEERGGGYAEPESPGGSSNSGDGGKQSPSEVSVSEGESSSSEGVLVEHPLNPDQDSRCLHVDPDSGVLVNIDGSMQEGDREAEDAGREDNFVDAPDQLSFSEGRGSGGLGESMAVIDVGQSNREKTLVEEVARLSAQLKGTSAECRKYKEEIEVYGRKIVNLHRQLQTMVDCRSGLVSADNTKVEGGEEGEHLTSLIPLNVMVNDCSKLASHLKNDLDERLQSEGYATELKAIVCAKDQAIEELNMKVSENSLSHDVVFSYLTSVREMWVESLKHTTDAAARRLLAALRTVLPEDDEYPEDSIIPGIPLVERRTAMLVDKHSHIMSDIEQLGQCLVAVRSDFVLPKQNEVGTVFDAACQELLESKSNVSYFLETIDELRKEKDGMLEQLDTAKHDLEEAKAETSKTKTELEQAENKFVTAKEKLSMAVTKGKSLVQQRESLKHSLTEKTGELEKCLLELQQKSDTLEATKASVEELSKSQNLVLSLQDLLSQQNKVLHEIEEVVSQIGYPNDLRPMEVVDRVRWLVDQKQFAEGVLLESRKLKDALSSFDLPESVSTSDLEYQMRWLLDSFTQSKDDDIAKLQGELASTQSAVILCESQLLEARKEIDSLTTSVSKGKQEIDSLQVSHEDLMCKYEGIVEKFSQVSFEKNQLMQVLLELSENTGDYQSFSELDTVIRECIGKIRLWKNNSIESSLAKSEQFQRLQAILYVRNQEVVLSEMILEEELLDRTVILNLSNELNRASEDVLSLTNERESLQKEIERLEEKCSMLREKLSMAVKKGKGLVQEREGFKYSLDEKNSEIEKLKHDLQLQESAVIELNEQVKILSSDLEHSQQLEASMVSLKEDRDQFEWSLQESNDSLKRVTDLIYGISLPTSINSEEPAEKLKRIEEYIREIEAVKASAEQELENIKVETLTRATQLADAYATIRSLEDSLSQADKNVSVIIEEKEEAKLGKLSAEQELEKVKEDSGSLAGKLAQSYVTINNLQDALSQAENSISILTDEKNGVESRCKEEIVSLNEKLAACMKELAGTRGSLESQSSELINHLRNLQMLMKDQGLFVMMTERFKKNAEGLKNLGILIQRFHDKFAARALEGHPDSEALQQDSHLRKLLSIPQFEDYTNDKMVTMDSMVFVSVEDIPSFSKVLEASGNQMKHIMDRFRDFSAYVDKHITLLLQALQTTVNEVDGIVEHREKLTSDMNNLEAHNQVQEVKISALQNSMSMLLSACRKASQDLHIKFNDILDMDFIAEYKKDDSSLVPASGEDDGDGIEDQGINNSTDEYGMAATELLAAARRVNSETQQFARLKSMWLVAVDDLKKKLREAELAAEAAIQDKNATNAIILKLEADVKELHSSSKQMNLMMEDRQMKEDLLKDKEAEISSLQHKLAEKEKEEGKKLFLEEQLKQLYDRISMMEIPFKELEMDVEGHSFSNPVDKFFYVVDNVSKLQHLIKSLSLEREVSQSNLANHFHELEKLRKTSENYVIINQDLEDRKNDLIELSVGLEKIIQKLGGYDFFDHKKSFDVKGLLQLLESLIITSIQDSESLKSRVQELGDQLKASQTLNEELSSSIKLLEGSIHARPPLPDVSKEKAISEASSVATGSEISEIEDGGPIGKRSLSPVPAAAHVRAMRKGSSDHLALNIDPESERLIGPREIDDKGHVFKSLNTSGLIPKQGKHIADRIDGIWVSAGRILTSRPEARIGLIAYSFLLHVWVLGTIL